MVAFLMDVPSGSKELGRRRTLGINACRIDARLTQSLDDAIGHIARLEENHALCPIQASERLVAEKQRGSNIR